MFLRRSSSGPVHHLEWRIRLFGAGAILGVIGMYFQARWMIWTAIVVLITGFLLRFLPGLRPEEDAPEDEGPGDQPGP